MTFQFEYVNDQLCNILKTTQADLLGKDFRNYLDKTSIDLVAERYKKRQQGIDVPSEYDIKLLSSDGEIRDAKLSVSTVNFNGEIKSIAQVLDITEQLRTQRLESVLLKISQAVNEVSNLNEFLGIVREELSSILDTTNFYVALYDKTSDTYTFPYHVDEFDVIDEITQLELKDSLTDYVRRKKKAILVNSQIEKKLIEEGEIKGVVGSKCPIWLGAPLVVDSNVVGVIGLQNYHNEEAYNNNDIEVLRIISENVSSAIWRKQIVDKLTESELRYRDFISRSSEGIYRIDLDPPIDTKLSFEEQAAQIIKYGTIGECNNSFARMYGLSSYKEIIGKNLNVFYGNKISKENIKANIEFVKNKYKITDVETHEVNNEGENLIILNNSIGIVKNNKLNNIWGIQKDITESRRIRNVLQQIAEGISSSIGDSFFKSLVAFLGNTLKVDYAFIAELSEDGSSAESLAFWKKDKLIDNFRYNLKGTPSSLVLKQKSTTIIKNFQKEFPKDKLLNELDVKTYMGIPLISSVEKPIGILVILKKEDIKNIEFTKSVLEIFASRCSAEIERLNYVKEIVASKEEAEKSNKLKSDFLAQMSHEIRTPVNTILSFSSLLKENLEHKLDDDLKESFKIIENGGRRLIRTIDLILNVSQIQSGNLNLTPTELNLVKVINDLISEFTQEASKKNLELNFNSEYNELPITADSYTVTQIFANLIHNAIKYTHAGHITISLYKNNEEIIVSIKDTGIGMNEQYMTQLFDPFSQEETGYTRKFEGTGLGLTLVKKYCELNNAEIKVESKKNEGSTFYITFKN
jgi:PAS domain S-box-containing protein